MFSIVHCVFNDTEWLHLIYPCSGSCRCGGACLGQGPIYLWDLCCPTLVIWDISLILMSRLCLDLCCPTLITWNCPSLCSTEQGVLFAPFAHKSTGQNSALSSVGASVWNGLSFALRLLPWFQSDTFYSSLKNVLLVVLGSGALLSGSLDEVLCKSL